MRWLAVSVVVGGWAFAGWQNRPALVDAQPKVFALAIIASCLACWWFGRRSGRAGAVAVATARAEARAAAASVATSSATNAVVINVQAGGRAQAARDFGGLERAEWIGEPVRLIEQDSAVQWAEDMYGEGEQQEQGARSE